MSENPVNRKQSWHINTGLHFVLDLVRDGIIKLVKCAGVNNVADALTKSVPFPTLEKHRKYMWGSGVPFTALWVKLPGGLEERWGLQAGDRVVGTWVCDCCWNRATIPQGESKVVYLTG
eukprot:2847427-Rhodomonas_salina.1